LIDPKHVIKGIKKWHRTLIHRSETQPKLIRKTKTSDYEGTQISDEAHSRTQI